MASVIRIGGVDMSEYAEDVQVRTSPVFGAEFTNAKGKKRRNILGQQVDISAAFYDIPAGIAAALVQACSKDRVEVSCSYPINCNGEFERPSVNAEMSFLGSDGVRHWNISLSMTCPLMGDGL